MEEQKQPKNNNIMYIIGIILILAVVWYIFSNSFGEKAVENQLESQLKEQGINGDVNVKDGEITINMEGEDGEMQFQAGASAEIPADFPSDIPIYKNSNVITSLNMAGAVSVQFETQDSKEDITKFYEEEMEKNDWTRQTVTDSMGMYGATYIKNELQATIGVMDHPEKEGVMMFSISYLEE